MIPAPSSTTEKEAVDPDSSSDLRSLRRLARLLDSAIRLPGGFRIGLDGIIGLVPVLGDVVTAGLSTWIVLRAAGLGVSPAQLGRMMLNILVEAVIGVIPVLGNLFDFAWKANEKNLRILERHRPESPPGGSARGRLGTAVIVLAVGFLAILIGLSVLAGWLLYVLLSAVSA